MLTIEHLDKAFGQKQVLTDINLKLNDGSVCGLVGINGAGKSTLLRLIAGVYQRDAGTIQFNGKDIWQDPSIRKEIAFVADEPYTPMGMTIHSMKILYESMYDFDTAFFESMRAEFELDEQKPLTQFSKGMKRRTSILFALSTHPKLLLLDEAYDGLEPLARLRFKQILAQRIEEENLSVLIASHNLRELEDICDVYSILKDGTIAQYGDLIEDRNLLKKYQVAFDHEIGNDLFSAFDLVRYRSEGRVAQLVIRGEEEAVMEELRKLKPVLIDVLPVTFEEMFLYELEGRSESHE